MLGEEQLRTSSYQARPRATSARQALDWRRPDAPGRDVSFHEPQHRGSRIDQAGRRQLLHSCRQMRRLTAGGVVHVEIAANRSHDHITTVQPYPDLDRTP